MRKEKRRYGDRADYQRNYQREYNRRKNLPTPTREQPEWCECCGKIPEKTFHLDHDHCTGKFRGWLCASCNLGLGSLGDSVAALELALAYLRRAL